MTQSTSISSKITLTVPTAAGKVYKYEMRNQIGATEHEWKGFVKEFFDHDDSLKKTYYEKYFLDKKISVAIARGMLVYLFGHCLGYEEVEVVFLVGRG